MRRPDLYFTVGHEFRIRVDLDRRKVVIKCVTNEGKSLELETDYKALRQIHQEIKKASGGELP